MNSGTDFDDNDVARAYLHRPDYPPRLFERLLQATPGRHLAIDLGCGPGKIARSIAPHFDLVVALDPSMPMLRIGQEVDAGRHSNIRWVLAQAEAFEAPGPIDLVTAGASMHWMTHHLVFPRLMESIAPDGLVAVIDGDGAHEPPWKAAFGEFIKRWVGKLGGSFDDPSFRARMVAHEAWMDLEGRETFDLLHRRTLDEFIQCEHSRATWSRSKMGAERVAMFDNELRRILLPHAAEGVLEYTVRTSLVWGRPRATPIS